MRAILGILLPFLITLIPLAYLIFYSAKRLRLGQGTTILQTGSIALLIGLITPYIAILSSIMILSAIDQGTTNNRCYTFVAGFFSIGVGIEVFLIPILTLIFVLTEKERRKHQLASYVSAGESRSK